MYNRDIYQKDPSTRELVNAGVASVNDDRTSHALAVLRYEVETFVCNGQYEKGLSHILETFLRNIDQPQQPAVWISGFYGSGKSHLAKMLRALWDNTVFPDGATARGIAHLPQGIRDSLKELDVQAKRYGGVRAASGTLGAGASGSVRLALLRIIFKAANLPEQYHLARFVMWLKHEGSYDQLVATVEEQGFNWEEELDNFYVSEGIPQALVQIKPELFSSAAACKESLLSQYPYSEDVSSDDMVKAIRQALTTEGKFPLTLVVLDEVQQYIGEDSQRSIAVQEAVETCSKNFGGKLLFIGTGQTAVTGTSNLKKLEGRFTVRVELSDADVDAVIRQVLLAKKPEAREPVERVMQINLGEISRHLAGTTIGHMQADIPYFSQDYPILPVRRRFWEYTLRVLDQTGTDSQLRNQLSMIHKVIQTNLDKTLGNIVPTDYLYFDSANKLLQARILPRKVYEKTLTWYDGSETERLMARACGLIFLISKLADSNEEIGIRPTAETLADLLVEDLSSGSAALRATLPELLDHCELVIKIGNEYRIQTEESAAWNDEFLSQRSALSNEAHRIEAERNDRIRKKFGEIVGRIPLLHGKTKVSRELFLVFSAQLPEDAARKIAVWVRDGWSTDENSVRADARLAGSQSPTVFVFIPRRCADDLRHHLIDLKAASATLDKRGIPNTPEGTEARAAMETTRQTSEEKIGELIEEIFSEARVFQGGGMEITGNNVQQMVQEAAQNALQRLYPHFLMADHTGWAKVVEKAQKGVPDALNAVGDEGEIAKNPVCKALLTGIAGGNKGADIRLTFESAPYGWSRDAVDGGILALLTAGLIRAQNERGQSVSVGDVERKAIGKTFFTREATTVTTPQRLQIRKLLQKGGVPVKPGEEQRAVPQLLQKLQALAQEAGGEAPKPDRPDTSFLEDIRLLTGNEQLIAVYDQRDNLSESIDHWRQQAERIAQRWPVWMHLKELAGDASELPATAAVREQMALLEQKRLLLDEPDPITPLLDELTQMLRDELIRLQSEYLFRHTEGLVWLNRDEHWQRLKPAQRAQLLSSQNLHEEAHPKVAVQSTADVLDTLRQCSLSSFADRIAALPGRFDKITQEAVELCEPQAQVIRVPARTLKNTADIDAWLDEVRRQLNAALPNGPIVIH